MINQQYKNKLQINIKRNLINLRTRDKSKSATLLKEKNIEVLIKTPVFNTVSFLQLDFLIWKQIFFFSNEACLVCVWGGGESWGFFP